MGAIAVSKFYTLYVWRSNKIPKIKDYIYFPPNCGILQEHAVFENLK